MSVSTDAVARKVGVRQEAALAIERTTVAVETLGEEEHDIGKLLHLVPYVAVGNFPETQRGDALPHLEGLPDGLVGLILTHLRGVVLDPAQCAVRFESGKDTTINYSRQNKDLCYLQLKIFTNWG